MIDDDALPIHGGDLAAAEARYGVPRAEWLDLSTGINPNPYPVAGVSAAAWGALPDAARNEALLAAARAGYGVAAAAAVVAAPGTQALIQWLPRLIAAPGVAVVSPTYGEHAAAWAACGLPVREVAGIEAGDDAAVLVVVNPNNPDGRAYEALDLLRRAERRGRDGRWLIVDEAFCDVTPEISLARHAGIPGLIVLRSFGKFFGLAGARLGFALCPPEFGARLAAAMGPWAVSGPAAELGARALADRPWISAARRELAAMAARLDDLFARCGLTVAGGTDLFRLTHFEASLALYHALARQGVLVRAFAARPEWLRFGLPGNSAAFDRLEHALHAAMDETGRF
ncbi:threonine-phosphate decarboxylase CobD [Oleispirillum naphthae]|uniref:threonine-phosphate decarboxylase CobD n=1 Tax=Oleispirillum naphthae TaxID=2838853 RepID=UPI0030822ABB